MNCIIIEDQPPAQRILKRYISEFGTLVLKATFSDAIQALAFLQTEPIDLIFLDIHLPKLSGLDFLKALAKPPAVILTTAFPDYALESYEFNVVDYLLKPFSFQRFVKAVSKVSLKNAVESANTDSSNTTPRKEIFIKSGYEHIKISIDEIIYIKSDADYTEIIISDKKLLSSEPLRYWLERLPSNQFTRVHKSYIINVSKINRVASNQVYMAEDIKVPIGRTYKENFTKQFL